MWRLFVSGAAGRAPAPGAGRRSSPPTVTCSTSPAARTTRSISATPAAPPMRKLKRPSNSSASNADSGGVTACTGPTACAFLITRSARPPLSGASARSVTCTSRPTATGGTSPPRSPSPLRGAVGEVGDPGIAHGRCHPLDGVDGAEQTADGCEVRGAALPLEQQLVAGAQVFPALGQEQLGVLREVHGISRGRAGRPRGRATV